MYQRVLSEEDSVATKLQAVIFERQWQRGNGPDDCKDEGCAVLQREQFEELRAGQSDRGPWKDY